MSVNAWFTFATVITGSVVVTCICSLVIFFRMARALEALAFEDDDDDDDPMKEPFYRSPRLMPAACGLCNKPGGACTCTVSSTA